jgi:hypothetical protein
VHTEFWWGNVRERDHSEDLGLDGKVILKWIFKTWSRGGGWGMDWIYLTQIRERWRILVNVVMNLRVP